MTASPWPRRGVYKLGDGIWFVPSKSDPGGYRRVEWHHHPKTGVVFTCTCPAGQNRGQMRPAGQPEERPCRHVLRVGEAEAADGIPPRPAARVNPSTFVD